MWWERAGESERVPQASERRERESANESARVYHGTSHPAFHVRAATSGAHAQAGLHALMLPERLFFPEV